MKVGLLMTSVTLVVLLTAGCDGGKAPETAKPEAAKAQPADANSVTLKPEMAQRVKTAHPETVEIADQLQVPGQIEVDEQKLVRIGASVTGRIVDVRAQVGDTVRAGDELARIASPELTQAQLAYLRAYSQASLAERAAGRARQLLAADVIGSAELQRRESEQQVARAELSAAADQLRLLGLGNSALKALAGQGRILPSVAISASKSGVIIERKVSVGQVVQPADQLFAVANLSSVWVVGGVPEQDARAVKLGQKVDIQVPALGDALLAGRIVFVADTVNPETRTVMVRSQVDNASQQLKPAMLATMRIAGAAHSRLVVPAAAVVREANRDHVFVAQGNNRYVLTPVELGAAVGELRPVLKGLSAGQAIVVDGSFHLNNERKRAELE